MVENIDYNIFCATCWSSGSDIFIDTSIGELVCTHCGLVLPEYVWMNDEIYEK
jgi:transcription initiation factor TFIIIB Brf1 subunit/transcription initiation factor TFIIB